MGNLELQGIDLISLDAEGRIRRLDVLMRPEIVSQAWDYFRTVQTRSMQYTPLIRPEDVPAIWLNEETMAKYRPALKKYYYDPTKYKSYLDQLGITYPTIRQ